MRNYNNSVPQVRIEPPTTASHLLTPLHVCKRSHHDVSLQVDKKKTKNSLTNYATLINSYRFCILKICLVQKKKLSKIKYEYTHSILNYSNPTTSENCYINFGKFVNI